MIKINNLEKYVSFLLLKKYYFGILIKIIFILYNLNKNYTPRLKIIPKISANSARKMAAIDQEMASMLTTACTRIAKSNAIVKSQQRDEKDLTTEEKVVILRQIYNKNRVTFLSKFWKYLDLEDLPLFEISDNGYDNYAITFYIDKLKEANDPTVVERKIKNRRTNYMQTVLKQNGYFDKEELQNRNPLLYRQYIGQYETEEEKQSAAEQQLSNQNLSQFLLGTIDRNFREFRCKVDKAILEETEEEFEEGEDSEDDEEFKKCE